MIAWKFLRAGAIGPFSLFRWPAPGIWVNASDSVDSCAHGIHACRTRDLPLWIDAELWELELDGNVREGPDKLVAERGRLTAPVKTWTEAACREFAAACGLRARDSLASVLRGAGRPQEASAVTADGDLGALSAPLGALRADRDPGVAIAAGYLADALAFAPGGTGGLKPHSGAAVTAFVARQAVAHAEAQVLGLTPGTPEAVRAMAPVIAAETAAQAAWLARRLGLRSTGTARV